MKLRKTKSNERSTYTYESNDGTRVTIYPGKDGVTELDIKMLHALDDAEVYNNIKNTRPPVEDWQKKAIEEWKNSHPGEEPAKNWNLSLDQMTANEDEGGYGDKFRGLSDLSKEPDLKKRLAIESIHEVVATFPNDQIDLYELYYIKEYSKAEIAEKYHTSRANITQRVNRLEEKIKKYF
ncbi:sigma-70 family RNA polymerase sigma factor [Galactobacillus timonensis]|uniref:sigma-70 family RNA polymerase sigma factor n=1 Tax=Galactobacillus timonensis TaxID=2041840 RepID=UPI000C820E35|nr:sigma-70 family RNA polymerase sigma factor [Galactobacillus timonensis]